MSVETGTSNISNKFPILHFCLLILNTSIAGISIVLGAFIISNSMKPASIMDLNGELKQFQITVEDEKISSNIYYSHLIIGSILLVVSLLYIWNVVDYGLLFMYNPGQPYVCAYQKYLIKERKQYILKILNKKFDEPTN